MRRKKKAVERKIKNQVSFYAKKSYAKSAFYIN